MVDRIFYYLVIFNKIIVIVKDFSVFFRDILEDDNIEELDKIIFNNLIGLCII